MMIELVLFVTLGISHGFTITKVAVNAHLAEKEQVDFLLQRSWPVEGKAEERKALKEVENGQGVEIDDAFANIAGMSKEEWLKKVEAHKRKKKRG